jgi:hypothetical protein
MQTTHIPLAAKKHWTTPAITAVCSSSDAQVPKLLTVPVELVNVNIGGIVYAAVGPAS